MKKAIILSVLWVFTLCSFAQELCIDGIYYTVIDENNSLVAVSCGNKQVDYLNEEASYRNVNRAALFDYMYWVGNSYEGDIEIPAQVEVENDGVNKTYSVVSLGMGCFYRCSSLTSVVLPPSIETIEMGAFDSCINLESVNIPVGVTRISAYAFAGCYNLDSLDWPHAVDYIAPYTLSCVGRNKDYFTLNGIENITRVGVSGLAGMKSRQLPYMPKLTSLDYQCFYDSDFEVVNLSYLDCEVFDEIGLSAFKSCSKLQTVYLPKNFPKYFELNFEDCPALMQIQIYDEVPPELDEDFASYVHPECKLIVPEGCEAAYKAAPLWSNFKYIVGANSGISSQNIDFVKVKVYTGGIEINGCSNCEIYTIDGKLVYRGAPGWINLVSGAYVVTCDGIESKIIVP